MYHKETGETDIQSAPDLEGFSPSRLCGQCLWEGAFVHRTLPSLPEPPLAVGRSLQRRRRHREQHQQARPGPGLESHSHDITSHHRLPITFKERGEILHGYPTHLGCSHRASRHLATQSLSGHHPQPLSAKYNRKLTLSSDGKPVDNVKCGSLNYDHNTTDPTHESLRSAESTE